MPWQKVQNPWAPFEVLCEDEVETIVDAALTILQDQGFRFLHDESRRLLESAGAEAANDDGMTKLDRDFVIENISTVPSSFQLLARNSEYELDIGGNNIVFSSVGGPAFVNDLDNGRRTGTYEDLCNYFRVIQSLNIIHQEGGGCFEPMDLPPESRHLDLYFAQLTLLDKNA
ncbi:uncharacterized protein METZ01_LOCUS373846, partial [marine metagenome]